MAPTALAGLADDEVYELAVEAALLHQELAPNVGNGGGAGNEPTTALGRRRGPRPLASGCGHLNEAIYQKFDWPLKAYTTRVKNQRTRGTCTSFGISAAIEAYVWKYFGLPDKDLSEQELYAQGKGRWFPSANAYGDGLAGASTMEKMRLAWKQHLEPAWTYNGSSARIDWRDSYTMSCANYAQTCSDTNH